MHIHIPEEALDRHPWIGVPIGLAGAALFLWLGVNSYAEYRRYSGLRQPEEITVEAAVLTTESPRRWVTLRGGIWHCDWVIQRRRLGPERWLFGAIEGTQIPVTDAAFTKLIVIKFDGDVKCADVANKPVTGVLTSEGDRLWGGGVASELEQMRNFRTVLVLCAGAGPRKGLMWTLGSAGLFVVCCAFAAYFARKWLQKRQERARLEADVLRYGPR